MLNYVRRAFAGLVVAGLVAAVPLAVSAHEFTCEPRTPGYWCGGASVLLGNKDDTAFCESFQMGPGCGESVCAFFGYESCDQLCDFFHAANAGTNGSMADVLEKFWIALQLGSPEILPIGGIQCNGACGGGFPDCNAQEIEDLIACGDACRYDQEVVKNCIDAALNAYPGAPLCVSAY